MSMGISSAFAASITITHGDNYESGGGSARVYNAYKVFDASYTTLSGANDADDVDDFTYTPDDAAVSYSMASDSPWVSVMTAAEQTWFKVEQAANGDYVVTPAGTDGANYKTTAHAQAFAEYLEANIPATATATEVTVDGSAASVDAGYYLIVAKDGKDAATKLALVTTDVEMVEKNTYITTTKTVSETNYNVGDIVTYTATVTIPADTAISELKDGSTTEYKDGHGPIILHDEMDSALSFIGTAYNADTAPNGYSAVVGTDAFAGYTLSTTASDNCTFEITIPVTSDLLGKTITFTYKAEVNSTAATDTGLVNELFGELNGYKTTPDTVEVWTFDFNMIKVFDDASDTNLTATFALSTSETYEAGSSTTVYYTDAEHTATSETETEFSEVVTVPTNAIALKAVTGGYVKADSDDTGTVTTFTATNGTAINFNGFAAGEYYLHELSTSTGYNLLDGPVKITITDTTTGTGTSRQISHTVTPDDAGKIKVENHSGTVLPSTGGIGTTIFYVVGSILVVAAGVLLITKKRMSREG